VTRNSNRSRRWSLGPIEVYAYHDYSRHPWRSPLYIGGHLYRSRGFSRGVSGVTSSDSSGAVAVALLLLGLVVWMVGLIRGDQERADDGLDDTAVEIEIEDTP